MGDPRMTPVVRGIPDSGNRAQGALLQRAQDTVCTVECGFPRIALRA